MTEPAADLHLRHKPSNQANSHDDENKIFKKSTLLHWKEMPEHLQFNPYILTGYRPLSDAWGCISSMWYLHNETINIVTHGRTFDFFHTEVTDLYNKFIEQNATVIPATNIFALNLILTHEKIKNCV